MNDTNKLLFVGIAAISSLVLLGTFATQAVYAQATVTAVEELNSLIATITGIITTAAALTGGIIATYARMSQKLGWARESEVEKLLNIAKELESTDHWGKELDERLVAITDVINELPGGKNLLEQKRVDIKRWHNEASNLQTELDTIYKKLVPALLKK